MSTYGFWFLRVALRQMKGDRLDASVLQKVEKKFSHSTLPNAL